MRKGLIIFFVSALFALGAPSAFSRIYLRPKPIRILQTRSLMVSSVNSTAAPKTLTVSQPPAIPIVAVAEVQEANPHPAELLIPSINLTSPVQPLGVNSRGEMDVPDGSTSNVGWYEYGTVPGNTGSAVFDAHIFAAFKNLHNLKVGDDVYVITHGGTELHFVVEDAETYALADVPLQKLFNQSDAARLNLITCAGQLTADRSTFDHRLVVYTKLINN